MYEPTFKKLGFSCLVYCILCFLLNIKISDRRKVYLNIKMKFTFKVS